MTNPLILIVDDLKDNLIQLGTICASQAYRVLWAQSAEEALELVEDEVPDLILLDILMPGTDGFELCRSLKLGEKTKDVPILVISALSDLADKVKAFKLGAADYISRPFYSEEVLARISVHLNLKLSLDKLKDMTVRDEMTKTYNRRFAYEIIENLISRARRKNENFSLCFIDIDNLKWTNDTYGHASGDILIKVVVLAVNQRVRKSDFVCRLSGDEFLVVFPDCDRENAARIVSEIKTNLSEKTGGLEYPVDFSFGICDFAGRDLGANEMVKLADEAMYSQKKGKAKD